MNSLASAILKQFDALVEDYDRRLQPHSAYAAMPVPVRREAARRTLRFVAEWLQSGDDARLVQFLKTTAQERVAQGLDIEIMQYAVDVLGTVLEPLIEDVDTARLIWRTFFKVQGIIAREAAERQLVVEDALREAEERFRAIYEGANDAIMLLTPEGFFDCNPRTLEMFGFKTKEEFTAIHPADVSPPFQPDGQTSLPAAQEWIRTAYEQGYARFDWVHRRTNGQDFPAEVLLSAFDLGGQRILQATVRDITDRQQVEQALRASEAEMHALFAAMTDVILVLDAEGRYLKVAPTNPPLLYRPAATLEGKTLHEILPQSQADFFLGHIRQALTSNQMVNFEYSLTLEGELTWFAASVSPMLADRVVWVARDITAHKRLEQQIQESLERRERQVQTSTEVAQEIAGALALDELFYRVVTLIKERFGYYHAQIFRYEPALDAVVLVSSYGEAGRKMLAAGHKLAMGRGVVGVAAATGRFILAADVAQDKDWRPNPNLPDTQGELAVPIKLRDQVLGILDVQSTQAGALTADDQLLLEGLCGQIAIAIENVRLLEESQRRVTELSTLNEIGREFAATLTIEETCQAVYRQVNRLFKADNFVIGAYQEGSREWVQLFEMRGGEPGEIGLRGMGRDLISFILGTRQPVLLRDVEENERFHMAQSLQPVGPMAASWMGAPLLASGTVVGLMVIRDDEREGVYDEQHLALFSTIASQAAIAFQNARLFERARRHAEETAALNELSRTLSARLDVSQVLEQVYQGVSRLLNVDSFYIGLYDAERNEVTFPINVTESVVDRQIVVMPADQGLTGYIIQSSESLLIQSNVAEWLARKGMEPVGEPAQSWLGVPMMIGDQVLGVMAVQDHRRPNVYDEYDRDLLESIAAQATIAIQNARLFEETQNALNEMRQSEELLRTLIDATPDWIFIKDREHRYRLANQGYADALHLHPEDFIGKDDLALGFPEELVKGNPEKGIRGFWADDQLVMDTGEMQVYPNDPTMIDGVVHTFHTIKTPLRDADGHIWGVLAFARDITEREQLLADQQKRALQLQTAAEVSRAASSILDLDELLTQMVNLIQERFDLYYAGLFLVDAARQYAILHAGAGEAGRQMLAAGHRLALDENSMIGWCILNEQARIALDVGQDAVHFENPLLPETRSELALPLIVRGQALGAVTVQSMRESAFTDADVTVLQTMTDQVANAIANARLFEETQRALNEAQTLYQASQAVAESETAQEMLNVVIKYVLPEGADRVSLLRVERTLEGEPTSVEVVGFRDLQGEYQRLGIRLPVAALPIISRLGSETLVIQDVNESPEVDPVTCETLLKFNIVATCLTPLRVGGQLTGIMTASARQPMVFSPNQVRLLHLIVDRIATVLENRGLLERVRAALAEVQQSEQLMRTLMNNIPNPIFYKDINGVYQGCNIAFEAYLGRPRDQIIGHSVFDMAPKDLAEQYHAKDVELFEQPGTQVYESSVVYADGTRHDVIFNKATLFSPDGSVAGLVGVIVDISDRKQFEASLAEERNLMRTVIDATPDWIFIKDREHRYRLANQGYADALHLHPEDFIGKDDLALGFAEDLVKGDPEKGIRGFWTDDQLVMNTGEMQVYPNDPTTIDGVVHTFHTIKTPLRDADGYIWGVLAFSRDITASKEAERALLESEKRFRTLFEKSADATLIMDNGVFVDCNQAAVDMLHATDKAQFLFLPPERLSPERQPDGRLSTEKAVELTQIALEQGSHHFEWVYRRMDGQYFWTEVLLTPINIGDRYMIYTIWRDITERKQTEERVQETMRELERLTRAATRAGWQGLRETGQLATGYHFDRLQVQPAPDVWSPQVVQAVQQHTLIPATVEEAVVAAPMAVRGEIIGALGVFDDPEHPLSAGELALLQEIIEQGVLALESARLYQDTQRRAARERMTREITDAIQRAPDMESLMRITTEELARALGGAQAYMRLGVESLEPDSAQREGEPEDVQD